MDPGYWSCFFGLSPVRFVVPNGRSVALFTAVLSYRTLFRSHVRLFVAGPRFPPLLDTDGNLPDVLRQRRRRNGRFLFVVGPVHHVQLVVQHRRSSGKYWSLLWLLLF